MRKFVIVYNDRIKPVSATSKEKLEKAIKKDWDRQSNLDEDFFVSFGLNISFSDYSSGAVKVFTLSNWFKENSK